MENTAFPAKKIQTDIGILKDQNNEQHQNTSASVRIKLCRSRSIDPSGQITAGSGHCRGIQCLCWRHQEGFVLFNDWVVEPFSKALKKSNLYRELSNLDDRTLASLGISRSKIPYVVMNAFEGNTTEANETASVNGFQALAAAPIKTSSNDDDQSIAA